MQSFATYNPTRLDGLVQLALEPGPAVADAASVAFVAAWRTAEFDGPKPLRIADIAKNEFSYAHVD